ncbi:TetR/AcrR family transcriptional regulator [Fangia hongkongensis]|uniref:TetR/AcrR family transcriptional regulator n=1 Tax=Fangia hongkongensis TaxID=270495 RepID=UPI00037175EE|nr:TetR/AcrR family transcriptional regulator [Fangia hongkongensis]MBK2123943.1 TetR/AcrR family transcriptional regulator [Fangia hongkongensis]
MAKDTVKSKNGYERIIRAAKKLFVKNGFSGTSLRDVSTKANVPVSLIYHYFDNKVHLWKAVKLAFLKESGWQQHTDLEKGKNFEEFLSTFIHGRLQVLSDHPELVRIFDWQRMESNQAELVGVNTPHSPEQWKSIIDYIQYYRGQGELPESLSDDHMMSLLFGLLIGPFVKTGSAYFANNEAQKQYAESIHYMLLSIIQKYR